MKKGILLPLVLSSLLVLGGCMGAAEKAEGDFWKFMNTKNYSEALKAAELAQQPNFFNQTLEVDYNMVYAMAVANAQLGKKSEAINLLQKAIDMGLKDDQKIMGDELLEPIRDLKSFELMMSKSFGYEFSNAQVNLQEQMDEAEQESAQTAEDRQTRSSSKKTTVIRAGDIRLEMPIAE